MSEDNNKPDQNSDENELKNSLNSIESSNTASKPSESVVNDQNVKPIIVSGKVLDYLQDKPIALLDFIFLELKQATPAERAEILKLFPVNERQQKMSRDAVEKLIIYFLRSNPELEKYFTDECFIIIELTGRYWEMNSSLTLMRERDAERLKRMGNEATSGS